MKRSCLSVDLNRYVCIFKPPCKHDVFDVLDRQDVETDQRELYVVDVLEKTFLRTTEDLFLIEFSLIPGLMMMMGRSSLQIVFLIHGKPLEIL